jgi:hypothetical protein
LGEVRDVQEAVVVEEEVGEEVMQMKNWAIQMPWWISSKYLHAKFLVLSVVEEEEEEGVEEIPQPRVLEAVPLVIHSYA